MEINKIILVEKMHKLEKILGLTFNNIENLSNAMNRIVDTTKNDNNTLKIDDFDLMFRLKSSFLFLHNLIFNFLIELIDTVFEALIKKVVVGGLDVVENKIHHMLTFVFSEDKVIDNIAREINNKYPTLKGFDNCGLYRMMQFYDTYKDNEIVSPLVRQISWTII